MEFKDKVYQARMQLGLTQTEFAKALGFGFATVNRWENGVTKPNKLKEYGARDILLGVCHMETTIANGVLLEETSPINHIYCFDTLFSSYDAEKFSETTEKLTVYDTNHFLLEGEIKNV